MWIYYIVALLLYSVFYTQFTVPWQALDSAMTRNPQERNLMLTCRQYGGFIAGAVVGVITIPIVQRSAGSQDWMAHQRGDRLCHHDHHRPLSGQRSQAGGLL